MFSLFRVLTSRMFISAMAFVAIFLLGVTSTARAQPVERTGKQIVDSLCMSCHGTGAGGAPKIGDDKAWATRADKGLGALTASALAGIRQMPAHGGNPKLTDIEIQRAITYMVNQSGGHWIEPLSRTAATPPRSGEGNCRRSVREVPRDRRGRRAQDRRPRRVEGARSRRGTTRSSRPRSTATAQCRPRGYGRSHRRGIPRRDQLHDELAVALVEMTGAGRLPDAEGAWTQPRRNRTA